MFFSHGLVDQQQVGVTHGPQPLHLKLIISWGSGHPSLRRYPARDNPFWRSNLKKRGRSWQICRSLFDQVRAALLLWVFLRWFWNKPKRENPKEVLCVLDILNIWLVVWTWLICFSEGLKPPTSTSIWSHIHLRGSSRRKRLLPCWTRSRPRAPRSSWPWPRATSFLVRKKKAGLSGGFHQENLGYDENSMGIWNHQQITRGYHQR